MGLVVTIPQAQINKDVSEKTADLGCVAADSAIIAAGNRKPQ